EHTVTADLAADTACPHLRLLPPGRLRLRCPPGRVVRGREPQDLAGREGGAGRLGTDPGWSADLLPVVRGRARGRPEALARCRAHRALAGGGGARWRVLGLGARLRGHHRRPRRGARARTLPGAVCGVVAREG